MNNLVVVPGVHDAHESEQNNICIYYENNDSFIPQNINPYKVSIGANVDISLSQRNRQMLIFKTCHTWPANVVISLTANQLLPTIFTTNWHGLI